MESTNFSLNDQELSKIEDLANQVDSEVFMLFWQFTINSLEELDIVSNQHLSIEMFLIRLMHLNSVKKNSKVEIDIKKNNTNQNEEVDNSSKTINQIKNVSQEEKSKPETQTEIKAEKKIVIGSFENLIETCLKKKEMRLKYELEKNVNLVKFQNKRIEISFNESLNKEFVKELSSKLFEWTKERWIITFSQLKGEISIKDKKENFRKKLIDETRNSETYKNVINNFPDAELIDVKLKNESDDND